MSVIPAFTATVLQNGTEVRFSKISFKRDVSNLLPTWSVEFPEPISVLGSDLWSIKWGYAGAEWYLVNAVLATTIKSNDDLNKSIVGIEGNYTTGAAGDLGDYCLPKTFCFVNSEWLRQAAPNYQLKNGVLLVGAWRNQSGQSYDGQRWLYYRLPGKEMAEGTFECIVGPKTHHDVARYLGNLIGVDVRVNTPNFDILDTMTIQSGTPWLEAIVGIFNIWGPVVDIYQVNGRTVISIMDVYTDIVSGINDPIVYGASPTSLQTLEMDFAPTSPLVSVSKSVETKGAKANEILDHLIITGRATKNSVIGERALDFTPIDVPIVLLSIDETKTYTDNVDEKVTRNAPMVTVDGIEFYLSADTKNEIKKIKTQTHTIKNHVTQADMSGNKKRIPVEEETCFYNVDNLLVSKNVTQRYYGAQFTPVKTIESEYVMTKLPGNGVDALRLIKTKTTLQDYMAGPSLITLTTEFIQELVLFDWDNFEGTDYPTNPRPLADIVRQDYSKSAIDTAAGSTQDYVALTTHYKQSYINRDGDGALIKRDFDYARLSGVGRCNSQELDNPERKHDAQTLPDVTFKREFFRPNSGKIIGTFGRCYHKARTIHHDDIDTEAKAYLVARRAFVRKGINNTNVTVKTPVPVPVISLAIRLHLGDLTRVVNGTEVVISAQDYIIRSMDINIAAQTKKGSNNTKLTWDQTFTARSRY